MADRHPALRYNRASACSPGAVRRVRPGAGRRVPVFRARCRGARGYPGVRAELAGRRGGNRGRRRLRRADPLRARDPAGPTGRGSTTWSWIPRRHRSAITGSASIPERQDRHRTWTPSKQRSGTCPTFRRRASCSTTSRRCCSDPDGFRAAIDSLALPFRIRDRRGRRHREPRLHLRRGRRRPARRRLHPGRKPGKLPSTTRQRDATSSSTAPTPSRSTTTR